MRVYLVPAPEATDDYVLLDSIVNLLRPQAYNPLFHLYTKERWVDLLKRESFLSNIKTLNVSGGLSKLLRQLAQYSLPDIA